MKTMTLKEYMDEAEKRFGEDRKDWISVCPKCNTEQSFHDFERAGVAHDTIENQLGFSCFGRHHPNMGCDWTLGGLFQFHKLQIDHDGRMHPRFELAPRPIEKIGD